MTLVLTRAAVKAWLDATGTSQSTLAAWSGISESALSKWLHGGARELKPQNAQAIYAAMKAHPPKPKVRRTGVVSVPSGAGPAELAGPFLLRAFEVLADLMDNAESEGVRKDCALAIAAYAAGKPKMIATEKPREPPALDRDLMAALERVGKKSSP